MIGYYVHHHGNGHRARARAVLADWNEPSMILTSLPAESFESPVLELPYDYGGLEAEKTPEELHWAPLGSAGLAGRMRLIADWIDTARPDLMVVDVSVEVALLSRLCGVPFVYVRQTGDRRDAAHALAYRWARGLVAPYPSIASGERSLERSSTFKQRFTGGVTKFDGRRRPEPPPGNREVLVANGDGGAVAQMLRTCCPNWEIKSVAGELTLRQLTHASVVVGAAGNNLVSEVAFSRRGLVCIPQARPFAEQIDRAEALEADRAAVVVSTQPDPDGWEGLLERALDRAPRLERWADGTGARRMAAELEGFRAGVRSFRGPLAPDPSELHRSSGDPRATRAQATLPSDPESGGRWR